MAGHDKPVIGAINGAAVLARARTGAMLRHLIASGARFAKHPPGWACCPPGGLNVRAQSRRLARGR